MLWKSFRHGEDLLGGGDAGLCERDEPRVWALTVRARDTELVADAVSGVLDAGGCFSFRLFTV